MCFSILTIRGEDDQRGRPGDGVHPVQVGPWKKEIQEQASTLLEGKRYPKPVATHREPELLYSEIGKLKMKLNWLKKSPGSTSRDPAQVDRRRGGSGHCPAMRAGWRGWHRAPTPLARTRRTRSIPTCCAACRWSDQIRFGTPTSRISVCQAASPTRRRTSTGTRSGYSVGGSATAWKQCSVRHA